MQNLKHVSQISSLVPIAVLIFGALMIFVNMFTHSGDMIRSLFIKVEHPLTYHFPTYDNVLHHVVSGDAVNYEALKSDEMRKELDSAVDELAKLNPDQMESQQEQTCFWINSYNLLVLKAITDLYPIDSIMSRKMPRAFNTTRFLIGATDLSLQDIFKAHLIPSISGHPEDLFLTNGGAQGFPPLLNHAITPKTLESDATAAASSFVNNPDNAQYKKDRKTFILTPFFKWHEGLFDSAGGPHEWANRFLPSGKSVVLSDIQTLSTYAPDFNWRLNDTQLMAPQKDSNSAPNQK